jgi:hypothetical protein
MRAYSMKFDGAVLRRGFWLYVWEIREGTRTVLYVGRTGDSSSANASSPFRRIGQHLDLKPTAKGNALARQLSREGFVPDRCSFEMMAIGPLFEEQHDFDGHRGLRDKTAALERALADHLKARGHRVIGTHPRGGAYDADLLTRVCDYVEKRWPQAGAG